MTATATPAMQDEICAQFGIPFRRIRRDIHRPNLRLEVIAGGDEPEKRRMLVNVCRTARGAGIVYVRSRERAEELAVYLGAMGLAADRYHAGLDAEERAASQAAFMLGRTRFLVATVAFGMGIDKTNVRLVCHYDLPESPEAYVQEAGRAGRDGKPSRCVLLHVPADRRMQHGRLRHSRPAADRVAAVATAIRERLERGETLMVRDDLERELGAESAEIRVAISLLEQCGDLRRGFDAPHAVSLYVRRPPDSHEERALMERARLRPRQRLTLETREWCARLEVPPEALEPLLLTAAEAGWLEYRGSGRAMILQRAGDSSSSRERLRALLRRAADEDANRARALLGYLDTKACRAQFLAAYFATPLPAPCGGCDRCSTDRPTPNDQRQTTHGALGPSSFVTGHSSLAGAPPSADRDELVEEIYQRLRAWRRLVSDTEERAPFEVMPDEVLRAISEQQPHSAIELIGLPGLSATHIESHGEALVEIVMSATAAGRVPEDAAAYARTGPD
jgi:ATP-dependent DNA helicase RecQ